MYKMTEFEHGIMKFLTARGFSFSFDSYTKEFMFQKKLGDVFVVNGSFYVEPNPDFHVTIFVGNYLIVERYSYFSSGEDILKLVDNACREGEKALEKLQVRLAEFRMTGM